MIFFIRFITSACLYTLLGKANIWLSPASNILLVFGSRFFLILAPLMVKIFKRRAIPGALTLAAIGFGLLCLNQVVYITFGAILLGIGISVSGYLIRAEAAETIAGAANNKIAINLGSLFAGIILLFSLEVKNIFFMVAALILLLVALLANLRAKKSLAIILPVAQKVSRRNGLGWSCIGLAIGIKLYSVFSVLPQYILLHTGALPSWYGGLVFINSLLIVVLQKPIIHKVSKLQKNNCELKFTLVIMLMGMLLIIFPNFFYVNLCLGALFWIFILSLIECVASYLDVQGAKDGCLFIKELSVGIGGGICVLFTRCLPAHISGLALGLFGMLAILLAAGLLYPQTVFRVGLK